MTFTQIVFIEIHYSRLEQTAPIETMEWLLVCRQREEEALALLLYRE